MSFQSLANQFLIAMPNMRDRNFERTVTLLCQHDEHGCMGVVVNRRITEFSLKDILKHLNLYPERAPALASDAVFSGGPVHPELGMVLHDNQGHWESTVAVGERLGLTTSIDIIHAIAEGNGPARSMFMLGYAGWDSGQLEHEIRQNAWLCAPANADIIFDAPVEQRWELAAGQLGIDLATISTQSGHA